MYLLYVQYSTAVRTYSTVWLCSLWLKDTYSILRAVWNNCQASLQGLISQSVFPTSYLSPPSFIFIPSGHPFFISSLPSTSPPPFFLHLSPFLHSHPLHPYCVSPLPASSPLHPSSVSPHLPVLDRTVKIWDLSATTEVAQLGNHASYVRKVAFCEQSKVVFSASQTTVKVCWWK